VGAAVGFLLRGLDENDRLRPRAALRWAIVLAAGMAAFLIGLASA
jgi:hypothetical protein